MDGIIDGFWDANYEIWTPFDCAFEIGPQNLDNQIHQVLKNEWILFLGDSNTRGVAKILCETLSLPIIGDRLLRFVCIGPWITISYWMYWPTTLEIDKVYNETFNEFVTNLKNDGKYNGTIPYFPIPNCPTFVFLSVGSHSSHYVYHEMSGLQHQITHVLPSNVRKDRFSLLLITASNNRLLPDSMKGIAIRQTNPRINEKNQATVKIANSLDPPVPVMDFFSTTFVLGVNEKSSDAVHFSPLAYKSHLIYVLEFIHSRKNVSHICT